MKARIVVIDDEPQVADMVAATLQSEGYEVLTGYDGQMGMLLAVNEKPDLIVSDVNMPFIHGGKILEYIRRTPELARTPMIFLSGAPSDTVYPFVDANSRVVFLKKPLDIDELLSLVRHMLETYPTHSEE